MIEEVTIEEGSDTGPSVLRRYSQLKFCIKYFLVSSEVDPKIEEVSEANVVDFRLIIGNKVPLR